MFGISGEHLLILGIVLLIFGPRRLPELGHTLGKCVRNFKEALSGIEEAKFSRLEQPSKPVGEGAPAGTAPKSAEAPTSTVTESA